MTHAAPTPLQSHAARRWIPVALYTALGALWLLDTVLIGLQQHALTDWLPEATGLAALGLLLAPESRLSIEWRAGLAAAGSAAVTLGVALGRWPLPDWGLLETACLLVLIARTCRSVRRPGLAVALTAALGACVIDEPLRTEGTGITLTYPFLLTFAVGGAIGTGCYLRTLEARRARTVAAVRLAERLQLARELHDFVAHHVTGIVVQAQAADVIHQDAPHQVGPMLRNIAEAGQRTLDSMRRMVRVLREDDEAAAGRPGELYAELTTLVSAFCDQGDGSVARLEITALARRTRLLPEVESAVHRVVQEALTNVHRHAPGAQVTVRIHRTGDGLLRADVHNTAPPRPTTSPTGGTGGYGLTGLRERAQAVGGTLTAGPSDDGGWWIIAHFPALPVDADEALDRA
ncbi:sensor histidine kinase [Streptomyces spongiae]|uniref:histidine kinase n=1 Tax=Streptomyces spongiae TaxID=565072 RepID=A0A5N8XMN2_9ACTN|nr:histidine kinase [Streptomyces spongiae]MPY60544.1 two-component sensor histidine kinase [Streptomyces spongiae]